MAPHKGHEIDDSSLSICFSDSFPDTSVVGRIPRVVRKQVAQTECCRSEFICCGLQSVCSGLQSVGCRLQRVCGGLHSICCGLQSLCSGLQSVGCRLQSVCGGLQSICCGLQSVCGRLQSVGCRLQSVCCGLQRVSCGLQRASVSCKTGDRPIFKTVRLDKLLKLSYCAIKFYTLSYILRNFSAS